MHAFAPNGFDPLVWFLLNPWSTLIRGATLTTSRVDALRVVLFFCLKHGTPATTLVFFSNSLDPLDRVVVNLLDKFLLGAMAIFRVAAPKVASTTQPLSLNANLAKAHKQVETSNIIYIYI
jgi:hypothetical protein